MKCLHCKDRKAATSSRLCNTCYRDHSVRKLYPGSANKGGPGAEGDFNGGYTLPEPVFAQPGSELKIRELQRRAELGVALHHPADRRLDMVSIADRAALAEDELPLSPSDHQYSGHHKRKRRGSRL